MKKTYVSTNEMLLKLERDLEVKKLMKKERKKTMAAKTVKTKKKMVRKSVKPTVKELSLLDKLKVKVFNFIDLFKLVQ